VSANLERCCELVLSLLIGPVDAAESALFSVLREQKENTFGPPEIFDSVRLWPGLSTESGKGSAHWHVRIWEAAGLVEELVEG
jgi:hypothetical protein